MEIFSLPSAGYCCTDKCEAILVGLWAVLDQPDAGDVVRAGQMAIWKAPPTAQDSEAKRGSSEFAEQGEMSVLLHLMIAFLPAAEEMPAQGHTGSLSSCGVSSDLHQISPGLAGLPRCSFAGSVWTGTLPCSFPSETYPIPLPCTSQYP